MQRADAFAGVFRRRRCADPPGFLRSEIKQVSKRLAVGVLGHLREFGRKVSDVVGDMLDFWTVVVSSHTLNSPQKSNPGEKMRTEPLNEKEFDYRSRSFLIVH